MGIKEKMMEKMLKAKIAKSEQAAKAVIEEDLKKAEQEISEVRTKLMSLKCDKCNKFFSATLIDRIIDNMVIETDVDEEYDRVQKMVKRNV